MSIVRGDNKDEVSLLRLVKAGDSEALNSLIELHTPRLYRVVQRIVNDQDMAEEVIQEAWLRAWRALENLDTSKLIFPWLARIALNVARDQWRVKRPLEFSEIGEDANAVPDQAPGPEHILEEEQVLERLAWAVSRLRPTYRAVIALRYDAGMSYDEIAGALEIPLNTVRTHLRRAKLELRTRMSRDHDEPMG